MIVDFVFLVSVERNKRYVEIETSFYEKYNKYI